MLAIPFGSKGFGACQKMKSRGGKRGRELTALKGLGDSLRDGVERTRVDGQCRERACGFEGGSELAREGTVAVKPCGSSFLAGDGAEGQHSRIYFF